MILNDLIDLVNKEKRRQERVSAVQSLAVGTGILTASVLAIKILVAGKNKRKENDMKKNVADPFETIKDTIQDAQEKAGDIKREIKEGSHEINKDIHKTAEAVQKK